MAPAIVAPFQSRFPADSRPIIQVAADLQALRLDRGETSAPIEPPAAQQAVTADTAAQVQTAEIPDSAMALDLPTVRPASDATPDICNVRHRDAEHRNVRDRIDRASPGRDPGRRPHGDRAAAQGRPGPDIRESQGYAPASGCPANGCQACSPPTRRHQDASRPAAARARQRRGSDSGGAAGVSRSAVPGSHVPEPDAGASKYAVAATRRRQRADGWPLRTRNCHRSVLDRPPHGIDGGCASNSLFRRQRVLSCVA